MKACLYSNISDLVLFERVGFYRDDVAALRLGSSHVLATNSLRDLLRFRPKLVVSYFYSKSLLTAILCRLIGARIIITGGADQISPVLLNGWKLQTRQLIAFLCLIFAHRIYLSCSDDVVNFERLSFNFGFLKNKLKLVNHVVVPVIPVVPIASGRSRGKVDSNVCWWLF